MISLPYELLADDPSAFIGELERRLGLDPFRFEPERLNPSLSPTELRWYPRLARLVRATPLKQRLGRVYRWAVFNNRLRATFALLDRLWPAKPVTGELISDEILEQGRGMASRLAADPVYAPYAREYLFWPRPPAFA